MNEFAIDAASVAVVIGIVEALKPLGLSSRYAPLVSIGLGVVSGIALRQDQDILSAVYSGILVGLSASGLYSGTKAVTKPEWPTPDIDSLPDEK
jgi:hypothetical protein